MKQNESDISVGTYSHFFSFTKKLSVQNTYKFNEDF